MTDTPRGRARVGSLPAWARAALVSVALGVWWIATLDLHRSWGWDEASHAQLPAIRMWLSIQEGDITGFGRVLHSCQQYPFGWPLVLGALQGALGISEFVARAAGIAAWALTLFGVFLLAQEASRARRVEGEGPRPSDDMVPWLAMAFAGLSPLALGYAGSLFLEVPFACCSVFALRAWLRRGGSPSSAQHQVGVEGAIGRGGVLRELIAGTWLTAAFFIKFNYGILLIFGCGLDYLIGLFRAKRAGSFWSELHRLPFLSLPLVIGLGWWLLLPLPYGFEEGAEHRRVMFEFLGSNREMATTPWAQRVIFWSVFLTYTARLFGLQVLGLLTSLRWSLAPGARSLWIVFLGAGLPVWTHNFHLDRFLIPTAPCFWVLAALGVAAWLPSRPLRRALVVGPLALVCLAMPSWDGPWVARRLGLVRGDASTVDYITTILSAKHRLGATRRMWTPGISPASTGAVLDLVRGEVGERESLGWIGISTELCPAAIHLALLEESGNRDRFLRDAHRPMDVTFTGSDPNWSAQQLREFVERFDVVISTDPPDIGNRAGRAFVRRYSTQLVNELGWGVRLLGTVTIQEEGRPDRELSVYALRPASDS